MSLFVQLMCLCIYRSCIQRFNSPIHSSKGSLTVLHWYNMSRVPRISWFCGWFQWLNGRAYEDGEAVVWVPDLELEVAAKEGLRHQRGVELEHVHLRVHEQLHLRPVLRAQLLQPEQVKKKPLLSYIFCYITWKTSLHFVLSQSINFFVSRDSVMRFSKLGFLFLLVPLEVSYDNFVFLAQFRRSTPGVGYILRCLSQLLKQKYCRWTLLANSIRVMYSIRKILIWLVLFKNSQV